MLDLPLELIRKILEDIVHNVDYWIYRHDLCAVSLSCRPLRHEAQRVLFRDSGELHTTTTARNQTIAFMDSVISSPKRLALYVKTFKIRFDDRTHSTAEETTAFVQKLSNALHTMCNLVSVDVSQWTHSVQSLPNILQHVNAKLTSFSWSGYPQTASEATHTKLDFLRRQDKIERLFMWGFIDEGPLKSIAVNICPRLKSLSAIYSITEILLPGKQNINSLEWRALPDGDVPQLDQDPDADVPSNLELMSNQLRRIRYLSYDIICSLVPVGPSIRRVAPYLTSLVCLNTHRGVIKYVEMLSQLPRLKILVLRAGFYDSWPEDDDLVKVCVSCRSLDHIDVEEDSGAIFRFKYDHSSKTLQSRAIDMSDSCSPWIRNFDAFDH